MAIQRLSVGTLVSVVIPTRNRRERLARTLKTVLSQDYPEIEVIVSDDGSSDGTADYVSSLSDQGVRVVRSPTSTGVAAARNRGIRAAGGRWIAVCDDDDLWLPTKLSKQLRWVRSHGRRWCFCSAVHVNDDLQPLQANLALPQHFAARLANQNAVPGGCSSVLVERDLILDVGGFDDRYSMFADYDMWIRLAQREEPAIMPDFGLLYVQHEQQMSAHAMATASEELIALRVQHRSFLDHHGFCSPNPLDEWLVIRLKRSGHRRRALQHILSARTGSAVSPTLLRLAARATLRKPSILRHRPRQREPKPELEAAVAEVRAVLEQSVPRSSPPLV